jgi:hypothetical protein
LVLFHLCRQGSAGHWNSPGLDDLVAFDEPGKGLLFSDFIRDEGLIRTEGKVGNLYRLRIFDGGIGWVVPRAKPLNLL